MKRFLTLLLSLVLMLPTISLVGCAKEDADKKVIRICNCEDYIQEELLEQFTEETGIEVIYSTYGTNENLYNELVINPNSYDLVVPSEYMIEKLAVEGRIQPILKNETYASKLSDYDKNISPFIKERLKGIKITGENAVANTTLYDYMVGYMWGTMGWVYNTDNVTENDVKNWDSVFKNPALNKKITIKDSVRDSYIIGLAMVYKNELKPLIDGKETINNQAITEILNRTDDNSIKLVGEKLNSLKNQLYGFEVDSGKNDIVLGNIDAYVAWSGDAAYAIDVASGDAEDEDGTILDANKRRSLSYYIPDEGSNIWFDGFVMPSGSTNYDAVYKFLEFISRSSSVYENMNYTGYTSMIAKGKDFELEDEDGKPYSTNLYDEVVVNWFDESEDLEDGEGIEVDLSYFFGQGVDPIKVSKESYGRLIAQYPTKEQVNRCAVMSYFDSDKIMSINEMWEEVKGETLPDWVIALTIILVVILAVGIILYRNKDKISWLKLPERKTTYAQRHNLTLISKREIKE